MESKEQLHQQQQHQQSVTSAAPASASTPPMVPVQSASPSILVVPSTSTSTASTAPSNSNNANTSVASTSVSSSTTQPLAPLRISRNLTCDSTHFTLSFLSRMTPRSMESLRQLGVMQSELVVKSYEEFAETGLDERIQRMRYEEYESMRHETLELVRKERERMVREGWTTTIPPAQKLRTMKAAAASGVRSRSGSRGNSTSHSRTHSTRVSPVRSINALVMAKSATTGNLHNNGALSSTSAPSHRPTTSQSNGSLLSPSSSASMLSPSFSHTSPPSTVLPEDLLFLAEQDRLRKTMIRQNKEIESMMAYELKVAQMHVRQKMKAEVRKEKEEKLARKREEERKKQAAKRKAWEQSKLEEEERLKIAHLQSLQKMTEQEEKHLAELQQRDLDRKQLASKKAEERQKKKLEAEIRTKENLEKSYVEAKEREKELEVREQRRKDLLLHKKLTLAEEHARLKQSAAKRVSQVLTKNTQTIEEKKILLEKKMNEMESRLKQFDSIKTTIAYERTQEHIQKEKRRLEVVKESKEKEKERVKEIREKSEKHDAHQTSIVQQHSSDLRVKLERRRLNALRKQANVDRLKRVEEYQRTILNAKLEEEKRRMEDLSQQKAQLLKKRQVTNIELFRQKEELLRVFHDMSSKKNWEALSKLQVIDGKIWMNPPIAQQQQQHQEEEQQANEDNQSDPTVHPAPAALVAQSLPHSHSASTPSLHSPSYVASSTTTLPSPSPIPQRRISTHSRVGIDGGSDLFVPGRNNGYQNITTTTIKSPTILSPTLQPMQQQTKTPLISALQGLNQLVAGGRK